MASMPRRVPLAPRCRKRNRGGWVGGQLRSAASDPAALEQSLSGSQPPLVPGSMPTTYQATGDQGIGRLQSTLPQGPLEARASEQNAARVGALQTLAPDAQPGAVRDLLQ